MPISYFRILLFFILLQVGPQAFAQRKALIILLDGIPADVLERVETPHLDQIAIEGAYSRALMGGEIGGKSESPTISAVGYTTMITGTWANKHNVYGNGIENPDYKYATIFKMLRASQEDATLGIFSTWEDNRTKILGEGLKQTGFLKMDYVFDGYENDTIAFPHDENKAYLRKIDELVTEKTAETILSKGPNLSWVYLEYTDAIGHQFGDSPQMDEAVRLADAQVGRIWKAVEERRKSFGEEWLVFVTTDHGRTSEDGKGHGGQSDREREIWIVTNSKNLNLNFYDRKPEMVDIAPSIIGFLEIKLSKKQKKRLDGVSLLEF